MGERTEGSSDGDEEGAAGDDDCVHAEADAEVQQLAAQVPSSLTLHALALRTTHDGFGKP